MEDREDSGLDCSNSSGYRGFLEGRVNRLLMDWIWDVRKNC